MGSRASWCFHVACALLALAVLVAGVLAFWTSLQLFIRGNVLASFVLFWLGFLASLHGLGIFAAVVEGKM